MIRFVEPMDYEACLNIYNYYILNTSISFEIKCLTLDEYTNKINKIIEKYPFLVYEENNEILGFAYLDEFNFREAYKTTADLTIYLKPNSIKKGIGSMLYKILEELAIKNNIYLIISLITGSNIISQEFHKRNGFSFVAEIDNIAYKNNKWESLVYYQKMIKKIGE